MSHAPLRSREYRDVSDLILDLGRSDRGRRKGLHKLLEERPRDEVIPLLAMELSGCSEARTFERVAQALAKLGGGEAMEILARHARTQRRFPGLAIHALSRCADKRVIPLLMDLAEFGRHAQRVSAIRALGRMKEVQSIELLCRLSTTNGQTIGMIAAQALRRKGGFDGLTYAILGNSDVDTSARLQKLLALERAPLGWRRYSAAKALEKAHRGVLHPFRNEARSTLDLLKAREKLLRASMEAPDSALLRAADSALPDSATLLRGSEENLSAEPDSGSRRFLNYLKRLVLRV